MSELGSPGDDLNFRADNLNETCSSADESVDAIGPEKIEKLRELIYATKEQQTDVPEFVHPLMTSLSGARRMVLRRNKR